jgi:hypothetical protein
VRLGERAPIAVRTIGEVEATNGRAWPAVECSERESRQRAATGEPSATRQMWIGGKRA